MPLYEFEYTDSQGNVKREEIFFSMSDVPDAIVVTEVDAEGTVIFHTAHRVMSLTARMVGNWGRGRHEPGLPDEKAIGT